MSFDPATLQATAIVAAAFIQQNRPTTIAELDAALKGIYQSISSISDPVAPEVTAPTPAINPRKSVSQDAIVSLIDGKPYKMLTRHIKLHGYTPQTYRETFGLKPDSPMTAPAYSAARSALAKTLGLGQRRKAA